ncbi:MAG: hypothetical protein ABI743_00895 [bacterium]
MRSLISLFIGLLVLTCVTPAFAKPKADPPPLNLIAVAATVGELDALVDKEVWPVKWELSELDAVRAALGSENANLLTRLNGVLHDDTLKKPEQKKWLVANFCPAFDPGGTRDDLDTLTSACVDMRKSFPVGAGGMPAVKRFIKLTDELESYSGRPRFDHNPCDTEVWGDPHVSE